MYDENKALVRLGKSLACFTVINEKGEALQEGTGLHFQAVRYNLFQNTCIFFFFMV